MFKELNNIWKEAQEAWENDSFRSTQYELSKREVRIQAQKLVDLIEASVSTLPPENVQRFGRRSRKHGYGTIASFHNEHGAEVKVSFARNTGEELGDEIANASLTIQD